MDSTTGSPAAGNPPAGAPPEGMLDKLVRAVKPAAAPPILYCREAAAVLENERQQLENAHSQKGIERGLALSGGGIRSAAFACGVLEGLAEAAKLESFSYLSTVSGGGYAGSALTWALRTQNPDKGANDFARLTVQRGDRQIPLISLIRARANYLAPTATFTLLTSLINTVRVSVTSLLIYFSTMAILMMPLAAGYAVLAHWIYDALGLGRSIAQFDKSIPLSVVTAKGQVYTLVDLVNAYTYDPALVFVALAGIAALIAAFLAVCVAYVIAYVIWPDFEVSYASRLSNLKNFSLISNIGIVLLGFLVLPIIHGFVMKVDDDTAIMVENLPSPQQLYQYLVGAAIPGAVGAISLAISKITKLTPRMRVFLIRLAGAAFFLLFMALVYGVAAGAVAYLFGKGTQPLSLSSLDWSVLGSSGVALLFVIAVFMRSNPNYISAHRFYRDRLMEAFMPMPSADGKKWADVPDPLNADKAALSAMCLGRQTQPLPEAERYRGPYHIINANVVLIGSNNAKIFQRAGDSFILSPLFCGSDATGWMDTSRYSFGSAGKKGSPLSLATAMAISAAAANPNTSGGDRDALTRRWSISFLMTLFNIRLGYWQQNPFLAQNQRSPEPSFWHPGVISLFSRYSDEKRDFVELSDGGHFDNTGLYELFRRRLPLIVLSDASADPDYALEDFGRALALAHIDFGIRISFDLKKMDDLLSGWKNEKPKPGEPNPYRGKGFPDTTEALRAVLLHRGYAVADIHYARQADETRDPPVGRLIYMKPAAIVGAPVDVASYALAKPAFPHESTSNQFFTERQFEAYRRLGIDISTAAAREF